VLSNHRNIAIKQKTIRMKKLFALVLTFLLFAAVGAMVSMERAPVDNDVGICYLAPIDQASDVVMYIADNNTISMPEYRSPIVSGVEKPDIVIYNDEENFQCSDYSAIQNFDYKPDLLSGFRNEIDKYPFASDLGLRKS
jgi:hypothetical protein